MTRDDTKLMAKYHGQNFTKNFKKNNERLFHVFMVKTQDNKKKIKPMIFDNYFEAKIYMKKNYS